MFKKTGCLHMQTACLLLLNRLGTAQLYGSQEFTSPGFENLILASVVTLVVIALIVFHGQIPPYSSALFALIHNLL